MNDKATVIVPKCSATGWCTAMSKFLNDTGAYGSKGLNVLTLVDTQTGRTLPPLGVVYKRSARDAGVMLNVCPWCAKPIRFGAATPLVHRPRRGHKASAPKPAAPPQEPV